LINADARSIEETEGFGYFKKVYTISSTPKKRKSNGSVSKE
jgi:hypothetical protein